MSAVQAGVGAVHWLSSVHCTQSPELVSQTNPDDEQSGPASLRQLGTQLDVERSHTESVPQSRELWQPQSPEDKQSGPASAPMHCVLEEQGLQRPVPWSQKWRPPSVVQSVPPSTMQLARQKVLSQTLPLPQSPLPLQPQ
jgi:hypothetical protein